MIVEKSLQAVTGYLGANVSGKAGKSRDVASYPAVTISRQVGARATSIAEVLVKRFEKARQPDSPPWRIYGNDLIEKVLRESNLPERLARYFPEDRSKSFTGTVEEIVGLHPSAYEMNRRCHETIFNLCRLGNSIVIGRCGNYLARDLPNALHVRLVGSLERRVRHLARIRGESLEQARAYARKEDGERRRYAKENFSVSNLDDPLDYDLVINTDHLTDVAIAAMIESAALAKLQ